MKRTEFLALMLSPLLAPFVTSSEPEKVVFPNGAKLHFYPGQKEAIGRMIDDHRMDAYRYFSGQQFSQIEIDGIRQQLLNNRTTQVYNHIKRINL